MNPVEIPPYDPPWRLRGGHRQTILPTLFRTVEGVAYQRERIDLPDGDFLDLDWVDGDDPSTDAPHGGVAILSHGLEGSSDRFYMRGMARALARRGWRVCAWNLRGCSGEPNRLLRAYHSGATEDLDAVVSHALRQGARSVALVGFSLGGNITLKWLGDLGAEVPPEVSGAACFSVPVDLAGSSAVMEGLTRRVYMRRFLQTLGAKSIEKAGRFPEAPDPTGVEAMRTFREFDGFFTAPVHGFADAEDYWRRASSLPVLPDIRVPTLLVQALDDPFLSASCYPRAVAAENPFLQLETPRYGGHVGFMVSGDEYWSETVAARFLATVATGLP